MSRPSIIAIGGSAGAIRALLTILSGFPDDFAVSIFIVVHTSSQESELAKVLGRSTGMRVVRAEQGAKIAPRIIYIAPPDLHLSVSPSHLFLSRGPKINRHRPAVDSLFESVARAFGQRAVGVLLSGYLDDGTAGLAAIKENGGITVVQDPVDAEAPNMPRSALANVAIDYCVPVAEISPLLVQLANGRKSKR